METAYILKNVLLYTFTHFGFLPFWWGLLTPAPEISPLLYSSTAVPSSLIRGEVTTSPLPINSSIAWHSALSFAYCSLYTTTDY